MTTRWVLWGGGKGSARCWGLGMYVPCLALRCMLTSKEVHSRQYVLYCIVCTVLHTLPQARYRPTQRCRKNYPRLLGTYSVCRRMRTYLTYAHTHTHTHTQRGVMFWMSWGSHLLLLWPPSIIHRLVCVYNPFSFKNSCSCRKEINE